MNAKQKLHQVHLQEWASQFTDQKASGLTVKQWCEQNHFSIHTYNYWKHLLKEEVVDQMLPDIVPLPAPPVATPVLPLEPDTHDSNRANRAIHSNGSPLCLETLTLTTLPAFTLSAATRICALGLTPSQLLSNENTA